jgi:hypothetical protein
MALIADRCTGDPPALNGSEVEVTQEVESSQAMQTFAARLLPVLDLCRREVSASPSCDDLAGQAERCSVRERQAAPSVPRGLERFSV